MDAGEGEPLVAGAVEASTSTSPSATSASPSAAASASAPASAAAPAAAAPGLLGLVVEALDLLGGTAGGSPRLEGVFGGVGLYDGPDVLALLLALQYLHVGRQRRTWPIVDTPPSAVYRHQSRGRVAEELGQPLEGLVHPGGDVADLAGLEMALVISD